MIGTAVSRFSGRRGGLNRAAAQPNFSTSRGEVEPAAPYAGDVVRHVFTD